MAIVPFVIAGLQFYGVIDMALGRICFVVAYLIGLGGIAFSEFLWDKEVSTKVFVAVIAATVWSAALFSLDVWARKHVPVQQVSGPLPPPKTSATDLAHDIARELEKSKPKLAPPKSASPPPPIAPTKEPPRFKIINLTIQPLPRPETRGIVRFEYQNVGETVSQGATVQFAVLPRTSSFEPALAFYDERTSLIEPDDKPIAVGRYMEFGDDYYDIRIKITFKTLGNQSEQPPQCFFYKWGGRLIPHKIEPLNEEEQEQTEKYFKLHEPKQP
jgi:hypothetical protein